MKKILLALLFFIFFFLGTAPAYALDCSNRGSSGFDGTNTCNPQNYTECRDSEEYADCVSVSGCRFFENSGSLKAYCAYNPGSTPAPQYNCDNRDPRCPASTHDCEKIDITKPYSCGASTQCLMTNLNTGEKWCASLKTAPTPSPPPPPSSPVGDCPQDLWENSCPSKEWPYCKRNVRTCQQIDPDSGKQVGCVINEISNDNRVVIDCATKAPYDHPASGQIRPDAPSCIQLNQKGCKGNAGTKGTCCGTTVCVGVGAFVDNGTCEEPVGIRGPQCDICVAPYYMIDGKCGNEFIPQEELRDPKTVYCKFDEICTRGTCKRQKVDFYSTPPPSPLNFNPCPKDGDPQTPGWNASTGNCDQVLTGLGITLGTSAQAIGKGLLGILITVGGAIAFIIIVITGYRLMTSQGDPEKIKAAREQLTSAIVGLLFIIFSVSILSFLGFDVLRIPGFGE